MPVWELLTSIMEEGAAPAVLPLLIQPGDAGSDYAVIVEGEHYRLHRQILEKHCDYFSTMFKSQMRESREDSVELHGITKNGFAPLMDFMYGKDLDLTDKNLQDVFQAVTHLQALDAKMLCQSYMTVNLCFENCVDFLNIAETFSLEDTCALIKGFMVKDMFAFSDTDYFQQLRLDQISTLLAMDRLGANLREIGVFQVALKWLNFNRSERYPYAGKIMKSVRFGLLTSEQIIHHVKKVKVIQENDECKKLIEKASEYVMLLREQPLRQTPDTKLRSTKQELFVVGGLEKEYSETKPQCYVYAVNKNSPQKTELCESLPIRLSNLGVTVLSNFVFVCGGNDGHDARDIAFQYNPCHDRWREVSSMMEVRESHTLTAIENRLFAVGGCGYDAALSSVECYNPAKDAWAYVANLPKPTQGHAACGIGPLLYVSGGANSIISAHDTDAGTSALLMYHSPTNKWHRRMQMHFERFDHAMCYYQECLYVIGGQAKKFGEFSEVAQVESYNVVANQWTIISDMPTVQSQAGVALVDHVVYVVGGSTMSGGDTEEITGLMQAFDLREKAWRHCGYMKDPAQCMGLVAVFLP